MLTSTEEAELLTYSDSEARELLGYGSPNSLTATWDAPLTDEERSEARRLESSISSMTRDSEPHIRRRRLQALFQSALENALNDRFEDYWIKLNAAFNI